VLGNKIKIGTKRVWMHKSVRHTNFEAESVLSNDPWLFVELWLKRSKKTDALEFWLQVTFPPSYYHVLDEILPL
jgi:hypothetical protein